MSTNLFLEQEPTLKKNKKLKFPEIIPVTYGYLRVSTDKQNIETNRMNILKLANEKKLGNVIFVQEVVSGRKDWRNRSLGKLFEKMNPGDSLIMSELSRISRDFLGALEFISECRRKKINILSVIGDIPLVDDSNSLLLLSIANWKNQTDLESISARTKTGIAYAKSQGKICGRPPGRMVLENNTEANIAIIKGLITEGVKLHMIAKRMGCCYPTLRKFIVKYDICIDDPAIDQNDPHILASMDYNKDKR
jgi:putative DNA-invertase from lambdoid prophage Rac